MNDERIDEHDKGELLAILKDNRYHSPEDSETDEADESRRVINVYNPSWRSDEVRYLLKFYFYFYFKVLTNIDIIPYS